VSGPLYLLLEKKTGSTEGALAAVAEVAERLGMPGGTPPDEQLAGLALCRRGETPEAVSRALTWKDFEGFCSYIMRAKGYRVRENIILRKPRAQIDVLGVSGRVALAVDCKHWARTPGYSSLAKLVEAQKSRARRLHDTLDRIGPVAVAILTLADQGARFVDGGAIVPIFAFAHFLDSIESYEGRLELV
jgi:hypothetical protein